MNGAAWMWAGCLGLGLGLGCDSVGQGGRIADGPIGDGPIIATPARPELELVTNTGLVTRTPMRPTFPVKPTDNVTCETALPLTDAGLRDVPVEGGTIGEGCFALGGTIRYFAIEVGAHEVVEVRVRNPRPEFNGLQLQAAASCAPELAEPAADGGPSACYDGWTWLSDGVAIANPDDVARRFIVDATAPWNAVGQYDLEVLRAPLSSHHDCASALALPADGHVDDSLIGAGVARAEVGIGRALFYQITVPPLTRVSATVTSAQGSIYPYVTNGCGLDLTLDRSESANLGDAPKTMTIVVGTFWEGDDPSFSLAVELTDLAPEARCDDAMSLRSGEVATVDTAQGGPGPSACWCFVPTRSVYTEVEVPAGASLELVATIEGANGSDELGRVDLIELGDTCASECGTSAAFGFSGQAVLQLDNPSEVAVTRHILVNGSAGWNEHPRDPVVELSLRSTP